jgi:hypothetical protein
MNSVDRNERDRPGSRVKASPRIVTTNAIKGRMHELGMKNADDLAIKSGVSWADIKYFYFLNHDRETLERLSVALDLPPDYLSKLWNGEAP